MRALVIGDTHFQNQCVGYLENQLSACYDLINNNKPKVVVFLGDIFHHRTPSPEVNVRVWEFFVSLNKIPGLSKIVVLRGNHDSANKSDDGLTCLQTLSYPGSKISVVNHWEYDPEFNFFYIAHHEREEHIRDTLKICDRQVEFFKEIGEKYDPIVFGHFGYEGCINAGGYFDFNIKKDEFKYRTILGHIHSFSVYKNITILGTPWSTNFGEANSIHYIGLLTRNKDGEWSDLEKIEVDFGPRHYVSPLESLEVMEGDISNPKYFTMLRVTLDKFSEETVNNLREKIKEDYRVKHVDLKFNPIFDKKLNNRISDYDPTTTLTEIGSDIIDAYLEEQASSIPKEALQNGLDLIKQHADSESSC